MDKSRLESMRALAARVEPESEATDIYAISAAAEELIAEIERKDARIAELGEELASHKRMLLHACSDLGLVNEALELDPDDAGSGPIIDAIDELKKQLAEARNQALDEVELVLESWLDASGDRAAHENRRMTCCENERTYALDAVIKKILALKTLAQAVAEPQYEYNVLFSAITDSVKIEGNGIAVSVRQFADSLVKQGYRIHKLGQPEAGDPTQEQAADKPISLNNMFTAILTKFGAEVYNKRHQEFRLRHPDIAGQPVQEGEELLCQLWAMMETFGPYINLGMRDSPFKNLEILPFTKFEKCREATGS